MSDELPCGVRHPVHRDTVTCDRRLAHAGRHAGHWPHGDRPRLYWHGGRAA